MTWVPPLTLYHNILSLEYPTGKTFLAFNQQQTGLLQVKEQMLTNKGKRCRGGLQSWPIEYF